MGNPRRVSRIPSYAIQGNRRTRNKLSGTATELIKGEEEWEIEQILGKRHFRPREEATISRKMEGLLTRS